MPGIAQAQIVEECQTEIAAGSKREGSGKVPGGYREKRIFQFFEAVFAERAIEEPACKADRQENEEPNKVFLYSHLIAHLNEPLSKAVQLELLREREATPVGSP